MAADESEPGSEPDVADHVEEALPEYLLSSHSDLLLVMEYERRYLNIDFPERECDSCGEEVDHRVEKDTYREIVNTECSNCGHTRTVEYATDGGHELPETLGELVDVAEEKDTLECETCGDQVERRWLEDGECVGCREGPGVHAAPRTDGGLYEKYEVRKGGEPVEDCFVLEPESDSAAQEALITYAENTDDSELESDLREWVVDIRTRGESDAKTDQSSALRKLHSRFESIEHAVEEAIQDLRLGRNADDVAFELEIALEGGDDGE